MAVYNHLIARSFRLIASCKPLQSLNMPRTTLKTLLTTRNSTIMLNNGSKIICYIVCPAPYDFQHKKKGICGKENQQHS